MAQASAFSESTSLLRQTCSQSDERSRRVGIGAAICMVLSVGSLVVVSIIVNNGADTPGHHVALTAAKVPRPAHAKPAALRPAAMLLQLDSHDEARALDPPAVQHDGTAAKMDAPPPASCGPSGWKRVRVRKGAAVCRQDSEAESLEAAENVAVTPGDQGASDGGSRDGSLDNTEEDIKNQPGCQVVEYVNVCLDGGEHGRERTMLAGPFTSEAQHWHFMQFDLQGTGLLERGDRIVSYTGERPTPLPPFPFPLSQRLLTFPNHPKPKPNPEPTYSV